MTTTSKIGTKGLFQFDWGRNHLDGMRITERQEDEIVGKIIPEDSSISKAPMPFVDGSGQERGSGSGRFHIECLPITRPVLTPECPKPNNV